MYTINPAAPCFFRLANRSIMRFIPDRMATIQPGGKTGKAAQILA
jgi:hypothetical protein